MKYTLTLLFLCLTIFAKSQDYHLVRGYVYDENNQPLVAAEIRVKHTGLGATTNQKGQYEIRVENGMNRLIFTYVGYISQSIDLVSDKDIVKNVWLAPDENTFEAVEILRKKRDISYEVIQHVIDKKDSLNALYLTHKCDVYIKSVEEIESKEKEKKDDLPEEADFDRFEKKSDVEERIDSNGKKIPNLNLYEAHIVRNFKFPEDIKEERLAVKRIGDQRTLFYKSTTESDFNLYQNLLYIRSLGQNGIVSPFSNLAFTTYKFRVSDIYFDDEDRKIYTIMVMPRKLGNALFKGEIEVYEGLWQLKSVDLEVSKTALITFDAFSFKTTYALPEQRHIIIKQEFNWIVKDGSSKNTGHASAIFSNHVFDTVYAKKYFNAELRLTEKSAYEKDTTFWAKIRPEPLTTDEQTFVRHNDSIQMIYTSKVYLDSIDSIYNRITPLKLLWSGQGFIKREKKVNYEFSPLVSVIDPVAIGGLRARYYFSYYKKFENRKSISIAPFLNYGFKNQDFKGSLNLYYLQDPIKQTYIGLYGGRYFDFVNPFAPIVTILRRDNFFQKNYLSGYFSTELVNGLYVNIDVDLEQRESLENFKFASFGDSIFENNQPVFFDEHNALMTSFSIRYTPKQLYLKEPFEKIVLGSKYPTFSLSIDKAWNNVLKSPIKFAYMEFNIQQQFNVGIFGVSQYRFTMGRFLDTTNMRIMDYKYQRAGDPFFFTPSMYTYQLLDSTFPTFKLFLEGHYEHQFNGFIMNKIPLLKKTNIKTMAGGGFLLAPERKVQYVELFCGINRVLKIGKERLRLGLYYTVAQSNQFGFRSKYKVSFEFYNRTRNTWSF